MGRWIATIALVAWDLFAVALAVRLFSRGRTETAVGWALMVALFLFMTVLFFRPASRARRTGDATGPGPALPSEAGRGFVEIMRSSDPIAIEVMRGKLAANGIAAEIIGQHTSRMLGYLPVVPLRLLVPRADAPLALEIIAGKGAN